MCAKYSLRWGFQEQCQCNIIPPHTDSIQSQALNCEIWRSRGGEDDNVVILGCDAAYTRRYITTFRRNILFPSAGLKNHFQDYLFSPENAHSTFLRNVGTYIRENTVSQTKTITLSTIKFIVHQQTRIQSNQINIQWKYSLIQAMLIASTQFETTNCLRLALAFQFIIHAAHTDIQARNVNINACMIRQTYAGKNAIM
jgi:hypothetical protein